MTSSLGPAVGIDLGTTFSAVARLDDTGRPVTVSNAEGDLTTPSVVLFDGDDVVVGKEAVKAIATEADRVADCAKRDMGSREYRRPVDNRRYPPEVLQAYVLKKLCEDAARQIGPFDKAVITVPAYFDEVRRKGTQDAGYMAGLEVLDIINEPTAAAVAFGFQQGFLNAKGEAHAAQKVLVYDLGGGTFDVTLMEINGTEFTALATDGDVQLGGRDWDQRLVDFLAEEFLKAHAHDPRFDPRTDPDTAGQLWRECEDAKRALSARKKASVTCHFRGESLRVEVSREKFQELTRDLLDRTQFTVRQVLREADLDWGAIDRVLLVGGSSRMPMVVDMLRQLSGKEPDTSVSPDEAVAQGAALHAGLLLAKSQGQPPAFKIRNVNSHSLGVVGTDPATQRKRTAVLIPRNTRLPVKAHRVFKTSKDNQQSILVQIVEGESPSPEACTPLGTCVIRDLPPGLPARSSIDVEFRYGADGRLAVQVAVAGADRKAKQEITRDNSLSRDQLDDWRKKVTGR
ncbi:MAG TPA: Hsp70 family protein [Pirellulales bacterium]|jgi:molecular chaperone DnaK|nr:Hsp70 family protein [Pirellulales bacterium]